MSGIWSLKVAIVGESAVGKTSFVRRFVEKTFSSRSDSTIGMDYVKVQLKVNETPVELCIWDTAGQERFRSVISRFYRGVQGVIIMFDIKNRETFEDVSYWANEIRKNANNVPIILVANKCEDDERYAVSTDEIEQYANREEFIFLLASAKSGMNVDLAFKTLAAASLVYSKSKADSHRSTTDITASGNTNITRCCNE